MSKKRKNANNNQNEKQIKKKFSKNLTYGYTSSAGSKSVIANIYTYSKRKPKRLGKTCVHYDLDKLTCTLTGKICTDSYNCVSYVANLKEIQNKSAAPRRADNFNEVGVTAIVLSDNRKCTNEKHSVDDMDAIIRIAKPDGEIETSTFPAAYCRECDTYFMLKHDYKTAKQIGKILCPIIDFTNSSQTKKYYKNLTSSESRIHQLGYNVRRGSNYTKEQRQTILANILENTNISRHEIESCITRPMRQHKGQHNYSPAVLAWEEDLKFIRNYKLGDLPKVKIEKLIVGKRLR